VQTEQNKKSSDGHAGGIQTKDSVSWPNLCYPLASSQ
jgi:hypothetical protein